MTNVLVEKKSFLLKAFLFSLIAHIVLLFLFVVTLPTPKNLFKPSFNFLGALFKSQEMFDFVFDSSPIISDGKNKRLDVRYLERSKVSGSFMIDKPQNVQKRAVGKEIEKTTFSQQEIVDEVVDDFPPIEDFTLKPLKLDNK